MKRTDKTRYEWKKAYMEKVELMREWGVPEVTPQEFYRDLFPEGSLEKRGEINSGKGNIVASSSSEWRAVEKGILEIAESICYNMPRQK